MVRIQCVSAEALHRIPVHQRGQLIILQNIDLLLLVRGTETIEEMQHRNAGVNRTQMGHRPQIHTLLHIRGSQQRETGLPRGHDILMIAENTQCIRCQRPGAHMEDRGQEFPGNLIHVGNHQQKAL